MTGRNVLVAIVLPWLCALAIAQPAKGKKPGGKQVPDLAAEVAALAGPEVEVAARAAGTLGTSELPAAHDALLDALALGLSPPVAVPAMAALVLHPAPSDVLALARYAGHHNPTVRSAALTALASYPDPRARTAIIAGLRDQTTSVRAAAATAAGKGRVRDGVETLLLLLAKGEEASARALAQLADPDLARKVADHYGKVPDASLALCLGSMLRRTDFGPDPARVEIVRAIAKIQDPSAITQLSEYIAATPKTPPRPSRDEAELVVNARQGGGK